MLSIPGKNIRPFWETVKLGIVAAISARLPVEIRMLAKKKAREKRTVKTFHIC
jgi:hypothetical protein